MGVVENGSISGVLPSNDDVFAVHYPGYPSSTERAIDSLGGSNGTLKIHTDKSKRLELRFRPEDPDSHPIFGQLHSCNNFLLKISKKKVKNVDKRCSEETQAELLNLKETVIHESRTETAIPHEPDKKDELFDQLSIDIISRVSEAYDFEGMADYQYVPALHAESIRIKKRNWAEIEPSTDNGDILDMVLEDMMLLVPPHFSVKDCPEKVVLKPCGDPILKKKPEEVGEPNAEESSPAAKKMKIEPCLAIDFNIKEIPKEVNWGEFIPENSERWQWQNAVCELFAERPIWPKSSLAERLRDRGLNIANNILRRLLFIAAYYFSNGPYLRFWIRKGYDPRKDPESRIYQRTDFRVPPSLRSYCFADGASELNDRWDDICAFRIFPHKCQTLLQLFELQDDYIQREIRKPASQETCSLHTGWFSSQLIDSMRLRVAQRYFSVYPGVGAESFLKHVSFRFEKSKRAHLTVKNPKVDEKPKEVDENCVIENEEDDYDDEDELNVDENIGDDAYEDEELDLVDEDGDLLPYPYMDEDENVAKDYLQDLFGSFPFGATDQDKKQDNDLNNGEYQIYQHFSDNDDDDDDEHDY